MQTTGEEAFTRWTQAAGPWAQWIKPSLFAPAYFTWNAASETLPNVGWLPTPGDTALLIDLPGVEAVHTGIALNQRGYCTVPLFNTTLGHKEIIDATGIADTLLAESSGLNARQAGPPAFLIDSQRTSPLAVVKAGAYDNRWYVFASDFPTAGALQSAGIRKLLVVSAEILPDLRDALAQHHAGFELEVVDPKSELKAHFPKPRWIALRALSSLVHHASQNPKGNFGHLVPSAPSDRPFWDNIGGSSGG